MRLSGNPAPDIEASSSESPLYSEADEEYFHRIFGGVTTKQEEIDRVIAETNQTPQERIDPIMQAVLQIGVYELLYCPEIDYPIIIKEAVLLSQEFMHEQSHHFANGLLDQAAAKIRGTHK